MPYSKAEQRRILMANGYDPDQWEAIPQDEYFAPPTPLAAPPVALTPSSSALGSAYRGAKRSAIPAASALLATAGAASLLGPGTQPLAGILLPLAAGLGTGFGVSYLQEKIKPTTPEESAQIQADVKEHPIASVAGEIAPNLLAMKPSISNLRGMFRSLPKVGASVESDALRQAIISQRLNAALGGGLGAVLEGGGSLVRGEPVSPLRVASAALGGALLNEPNKIGRALGFKGSVDLQPSLSARQPEGFTGPPRPLRTQIDEQLVQPESALTRVYREHAGMYGQPSEPALPMEAPRIAHGESLPVGGNRILTDEGVRLVPEPEPPPGAYERQLKIEQLEKDIAEQEARIRHLPVEQRLPLQGTLDQAKASLVKEKANAVAEVQAQKVVFISPKGEAVSPKPDYPIQTPQDTIVREQQTIAQKQPTSRQQRVVETVATLKQRIATEPNQRMRDLLQRNLKAIEAFQNEKGQPNATNPKPEPQGNQPEHIGIPQGKNLPANQEEVRSQEGKLPSRGSRVQRGPPTIKKGKDFARNGEWEVTINGRVHKIFRDPETRYWYDAENLGGPGDYRGLLSTENRAEAIQELIKRHHSQPQKVAPIPDDWRVTVQNDAVEGGKVISPGYVQFDKPDNTGSFGPATIAKAGHTAPDYSGLPTGQYTIAEANKALAVKDSAMRLELRSQLGLSADEVTKLLQAKSPFDRGMNLLVALQKKGIKVQVLKHTPEGHRVAIEQALKQAGEIVEQVTGKPVSFKAGPEDAGEVMHQIETELAKAPLTDLLSHPNNREVFDLLSALAARERIQQGIEPSLVNDAGDAALGAAIFAQRATKLNASMLGEDTQAHEIAHILLRDRIVSNDPLAMRGLALFGGDEERLVQALGTRITDLAKLKVEGLTLKRFTEWVKDFVSSIKAAWGNATEDDFKRVLARRMLKGDYQPARVVVNDPKEVAYQTLANKQQDNREGLEAALNARSLVAEGVPGIRPVVARIAREASPELAEAFSKVAEDARSYRGKLTNFAQAGVEGLSKAEQEQALAYAYSMKDSKGAAPIPVSDKVLDWWEKSFRPFMGRVADEMEAIGKKIIDPETGARYIHRTPYYVPEMLLEHVQDVLLNKPNSPEAKRYVDQIVKFNANKLGISEEEARGIWESRGHAEHVTGHQGLLEYGPLSRSAGIGLPPELREQSLLRLVTRYGNRAAMALAWHKNVVGDPVAGYLAGVKDQFGKAYPRPDTMPDAKPLGNVPIVASTVKLLQGDFSPSDMLFDTLSRGVKVNIMQTLTGAADLTTWWVQVLPYIHPSRLGNIAKAHLYVREGIEHGLEQGVIQRHAMQMQSGYESGAGTQGGWVRRFNGYWDTINAITGRDGLERVTRGLTQMAGEMEAAANVAHAFNPTSPNGLKSHAIAFLDRFADKDWAKSIGDLVKAGQPVPDEMIQAMGARVVEAAQGMYDIRGLPMSALKGQLSPFLSLAKWNIEKANEFKKAVWNPLMKGNLTPFLMTTAGGLIGGTAVEQLREWMTKRKGSQASWQEIAAAGGDGLLYKAMALSSFSGYGGIVTELGKQGMDAIEGRPVTGFRFPAVAFIANTTDRLSQAFQAVQRGENLLQTFGVEFPYQLMKDNIQMARIGLNWTVDADQIKRANRLRDLRVFREQQGLSVARWSGSGSNPFLNQLDKQYEQTGNPAEAMQIAPQLRQMAFERGRGPSGAIDPERVRSLLNSYRAQATDVMPSVRSSPMQFRQYLQWVAQTQGAEKAQQLLAEYLQKERLDRLKTALIPSLSAGR